MKIIVVGVGKVGFTVAEQLVEERHDITVVDTNATALADAMNILDVMGINGNGAAHTVLKEAGVAECDLLIATTGSDEINLLCCLLARRLGAKSTIARVRNPEYHDSLALIKDSLGLSRAVNPEWEAASEILRIFKSPSALNVDLFAKGKVDLVSFVADNRCTLCGKKIRDSFATIMATSLICAVERGDQVMIPSGDFRIEENDTVVVLAMPDEISSFFAEIGLPQKEIRNAMIIGGERIAHYLATELGKSNTTLTLIEQNPEVARRLSLLLPRANVICGDAANHTLLLEEGMLDADVVCCLTGIDEENVLLSLYAKSMSPNVKTITRIDRTTFQDVVRSLDVGSVIYPKYTTASLILQHVRAWENKRGGSVETLYKIIHNKVEALEFHVSANSLLTGIPLQKLSLRKNVLLGCISRNGKVFIPHGKDMLMEGDSVVVVTTIPGLTELDNIKHR